MITTVEGVQVFYKAIEGNPCPACSKVSSVVSTTNEWKYHCLSCDIRFNSDNDILNKPLS